MKLEIDLPDEGPVQLSAESVNTRQDFGFAVRFVDVPADAQDKLNRVIDRLLTKSPLDE